jgi:uncharacterized protein (TIGR00369 family)
VSSPERSRTYSWADPLAALGEAAGLSGIDALRKIMTGELPPPPIANTLDFRLVEVEPGRVVFECEPAEFHYNPIGVVHAGLAVTLLDSAMGCAFVSTAESGTAWTTLELKANFTRALTMDTGTVRCIGTVVHPGRTVTTTEARVDDERGRLCAHGTSTILVLSSGSR